MKHLQIGQEATIGFVRDQEEEEEFFLQVRAKDTNDYIKIAVDDIDEIEHVESTLKFYIHYQKRSSQSTYGGESGTKKSGLGSILKRTSKKLTSKLVGNNDGDEEETEDCSELFESKFVKQIIESFNTVLELVE